MESSGMQHLQHVQHSCQVLLGSRVQCSGVNVCQFLCKAAGAAQFSMVAQHRILSPISSTAQQVTASMATNPSVSRCWLLQGHYVIMESLHQNATHLGTSKQHLVDHAFDDAFQVLQSYCWRAREKYVLSFVHLSPAIAAYSISL